MSILTVLKKFKETKLPDIDKFFSFLKDCGISKKEYQRACDVWKIFEIKIWENIMIFY